MTLVESGARDDVLLRTSASARNPVPNHRCGAVADGAASERPV